MRLVITKDSKNGRDKRTSGERGQRSRSCNCGQQLDICARAHCPRCGRTLNRS
ncbi:hypothetical protein [Nocardioides mesophilus]|uniref:Uncharacterized protein n=1 Tax=Nocardioides mesophilus TaxID=433659 RepID=A0A7G9RAR4_9ACTN|nr:hypothetical protein [Nocardioides mesophilus]QNN52689.1 hypothetical protein H9L09_19975 [Nocardioides mesophilus]